MGYESRQKGNALFLILIAVALFAALSYAMTQSGRGGGGSASREQLTLKVSQFVSYMGEIQSAVQRMVVSGTPVSSIKLYDTYEPFAPCTSGTDCVFSSTGGGVTYQDVATNFFSVGCGIHFYEAGGITGTVTGVGTTANELMFIADCLHDDVCDELDRQYHLPDSGQVHGGYNPTNAINDTYDAMPGEQSFCFDDAYPGAPHTNNGAYWHVFYAQ
jgi:hypothetical protein